jgi:hypothetical protein
MDRRMRSVVVTAIARIQKLLVDQHLRVLTPLLIVRLYADEVLQIRALLERIRLGSRVGDVPALVERLGDLHRAVRAVAEGLTRKTLEEGKKRRASQQMMKNHMRRKGSAADLLHLDRRERNGATEEHDTNKENRIRHGSPLREEFTRRLETDLFLVSRVLHSVISAAPSSMQSS